jgi:hypothetical protein
MPALHLKPWTEERLTEASEHTGRKSGQSAGAYVLDLAALQKAILLCDGCVPKFDARRLRWLQSDRPQPTPIRPLPQRAAMIGATR